MLREELDISYEDKLVVSCSRKELSSCQIDNIDGLVRRKLDWSYINNACRNHGVLPLVFNNLTKICPRRIPEPIKGDMREYCRLVAAQNMYMAARLVKLNKLFETSGIRMVPFKGPLLAEEVYGDLALRIFGDLDILISYDDVIRTCKLLIDEGYEPLISMSETQLKSYMKTENDLVFTQKSSGLVVELHWEMSGRVLARHLDLEFVDSGLQRSALFGLELPGLGNEDLLIYLCVHGNRHMWDRLEWLCCIGELVREKKDIDWDVILYKADELRCSRMLKHGLFLSWKVFGTELPSPICDLLKQDHAQPGLYVTIQRRIFPLYDENRGVVTGNMFQKHQFDVQDCLSLKVKYGWRQLFWAREADWRWLSMPGFLAFLYAVLRPVRLMLKYFKMGND